MSPAGDGPGGVLSAKDSAAVKHHRAEGRRNGVLLWSWPLCLAGCSTASLHSAESPPPLSISENINPILKHCCQLALSAANGWQPRVFVAILCPPADGNVNVSGFSKALGAEQP